MPRVYDSIDVVLTGLFAKPRVLQPDPSPQATGRCPHCRYWVVLPCAVCAAGYQATFVDTAALIAQVKGDAA